MYRPAGQADFGKDCRFVGLWGARTARWLASLAARFADCASEHGDSFCWPTGAIHGVLTAHAVECLRPEPAGVGPIRPVMLRSLPAAKDPSHPKPSSLPDCFLTRPSAARSIADCRGVEREQPRDARGWFAASCRRSLPYLPACNFPINFALRQDLVAAWRCERQAMKWPFSVISVCRLRRF